MSTLLLFYFWLSHLLTWWNFGAQLVSFWLSLSGKLRIVVILRLYFSVAYECGCRMVSRNSRGTL